MDINKSIKILKALSLGVKLESGEVILNHNDPEDKEIMKALELSLKLLKKKNKKNNKPARNGESWTKEEESELCFMYDKFSKEHIKDQQIVKNLSTIHERTPGAIVKRLQRNQRLSNKFYYKK